MDLFNIDFHFIALNYSSRPVSDLLRHMKGIVFLSLPNVWPHLNF